MVYCPDCNYFHRNCSTIGRSCKPDEADYELPCLYWWHKDEAEPGIQVIRLGAPDGITRLQDTLKRTLGE